jgi:hypothetical protein
MEVVDLIVDGAIFRVGSHCAFRGRFEPTMFHSIIITALRMPIEVIAEVVNFDPFFHQSLGVSGHIGMQVNKFQTKIFPQ